MRRGCGERGGLARGIWSAVAKRLLFIRIAKRRFRVVAERQFWSAVTRHRFCAGDLSPSNFRAAPVTRARWRWREP